MVRPSDAETLGRAPGRDNGTFFCLQDDRAGREAMSTDMRALRITVATVFMIAMAACFVGESVAKTGDATSREPMEKSKESSFPWVRIFPNYVRWVLVPVEQYRLDAPISVNAVLVGLSRDRAWKLENRVVSLASYSTGKVGPQGCLYWTGSRFQPDPKHRDARICAGLRDQAAVKFLSDLESCGQHRRDNLFSPVAPYLFVRTDLKEVRCLLDLSFGASEASWLEQASRAGYMARNTVAIRNDTSPEARRLGRENAYLGLATNRLFSCESYGTPVTYWRDEVPVHESQQENYPYHQRKPTWQKQYLIRTGGFQSQCWKAKRVVDEPERVGLRLNDGTVLLQGDVSVIRVRAKDGSTNAPPNQVKVLDPSYVRRMLDQQGGEKCRGDYLAAGICPLAQQAGAMVNSAKKVLAQKILERDFYPYVIQGVDSILLELFERKNEQ